MPEEVTILEDLQVIQVRSFGVITAEDFKATLEAILKIGKDQGLTKVLVDAIQVTSYPSTIPIFDFGSKAALALRGIRLGIALPPGITDPPRFFETVTRNRGANVKTCDSLNTALAWLIK